MNTSFRAGLLFLCIISLTGCVKKLGDSALPDTTRTVTTNTTMVRTSRSDMINYPVTLPVLDAFFSDSTFVGDAKSIAGLTDSDVSRVRLLAHNETIREETSDSLSTTAARQIAQAQLTGAIGSDKATKLITLVEQRWSGETSATSSGQDSSFSKFNAIPTDSRIVVNAPEYRMDVFQNGDLVKSYKVAIGYPEFPLPTGLRHASKIIFNPSWTTPDEPWVESSKKVTVGEKLNPGDKLNPLGIMKIPIGLPSLIHSGKNAGQLGTFGSHGCVGLTNDQAKDFVKHLAAISGDSLTDKDIAADTKTKDQSKEVALGHTIPVELRYETVVLEGGALHIFRDVYDHHTNTDSTVDAVLGQYGTSLSKLSSKEQTQITDALQRMDRDAKGDVANGEGTAVMTGSGSTSDSISNRAASGKSNNSAKRVSLTRTVIGQKEIVIPIAELSGKGYPTMASTQSSKKRH